MKIRSGLSSLVRLLTNARKIGTGQLRGPSYTHLFGLGFALVLLLAVALGSYTSWREYVIAADTTRETRAIINQLKSLLVRLQAAEIAQRTFLLNGNAGDLKDFTEARPAIEADLVRLDQWKLEYAHHPHLLAEFRASVLALLDVLGTAADLRQRGDSAGALRMVNTNHAKEVMEQVQELERRLEQHEEFSLSVTRVRSSSYAHISELTSTIGCCGIFVVVLLSAIQIHRLISTRNRLSEQLAQVAADFEHLADSVPQMVWRASEDGTIEYVNRRWIQFSGGQKKMSSAETWHTFLYPDDSEAFFAKWKDSLATYGPLAAECRMRDQATSRYRWFLFRADPVRDRTSGGLRWFGTFTDIDQQKATEEALQRSNEDLQQFVHSASHDLQEPLRTLVTYSQVLARRLNGVMDESANREFGILTESARRMQDLLKDLLAYSEVTGGEPESTEAADSAKVLKRVLKNLQSTVEATGGRVTYNDLPELPISETHLLQLFQNLIGNALKYRKPGIAPEIQVFARQQSAEWLVSVKDNGIGIDPAYHAKVFGIFKRLHSAHQYSGTGLGLAICRKIVERHGGRIWVESEAGVGSTFYFSLPVAAMATKEMSA